MPTEIKRVFGPPGTGQTTWLAQQAGLAAEKFGPDKVAICSFTRAAAVEIASRNTGVNRSHVGTLHSMCYQALGSPELAETHIKEWNDSCGAGYQLKDSGNDDFMRDSERSSGDQLFRRYQLLRAMKHSADQYPLDVIAFSKKWDDWKVQNAYVDFTDLIDFGRRELDYAPGMPKALFVDEAQDFNPIENELVEKWAQKTDWTIMVGDPDQSIYTFAGADPLAFLRAPAEQKFHPASLKRSWRLPSKVHQWSIDWIRQIRDRDDIVFAPRDAEGEVIKLSPKANWRDPEELVKLALSYTAQQKRVGILATCGYMLDPLKGVLRREGVPFHNPFRVARGDWNPLAKVGERVGMFLRPCREVWGKEADSWTGPMLYRWVDSIKADGVFRRGAKAHIKKNLKDIARPLYTELLELFEDGVFEEIMGRQEAGAVAACEWLLAHAINDAARDRLLYPIRCIERSGPQSIFREPKIIIGTGHSVKGADKIDVVILIPDLSSEADRGWRSTGPLRDATIRLIYVMATRARESLMLARSASDNSVWS